jgi:hypothetical protein
MEYIRLSVVDDKWEASSFFALYLIKQGGIRASSYISIISKHARVLQREKTNNQIIDKNVSMTQFFFQKSTDRITLVLV